MKLSNKATLSLYSPSKCSFTPSKLRFFGLRKVAIKANENKCIFFSEPEQPKAIVDGLSLKLALVIQLLKRKSVSENLLDTLIFLVWVYLLFEYLVEHLCQTIAGFAHQLLCQRLILVKI